MASIRKLQSGKWIATVRKVGSSSKSQTFNLRSEAVHWASMTEAALPSPRGGQSPYRPNLKVADLLSWFEENKIPGYRSQKTATGICRVLNRELGGLKVEVLSSRDVAHFRDKRLAAGLSGSSVIRELNLLSRALKVGNIELNLGLVINPALGVQRPAANRSRDRRPTQDEISKLDNLAQSSGQHELAVVMCLALETGMRQSEILSLAWDDLDLDARVATLRMTKNGDRRQVPISGRAKTALETLRPAVNTGQVFRRWSRPDSLKTAWKRLCKGAEVRDLRFHDLRHEAASRLFERGLNQFQVAAITGHKTLQMLKRYTHLKAADLANLLN